MQWYQLEKDKSTAIVERLKDEGMPGLFTPRVGDMRCAKLPFYNDWLVYRLTNYATLPAFSIDFLGNGTDFLYLDGTPKPFSTVAARGALVLNPYTVLDYLSFYYQYVGEEDEEVVVIRGEEDIPGLQGARVLPRPALVEALEGISVKPSAAPAGFQVTVPLYLGGALLFAGVFLHANGAPEIVSRRLLFEPARGGLSAQAASGGAS